VKKIDRDRPTRRGMSAVPFLGDLLALTRLLRDGQAGWGPKILALAALIYVVSPVDAFPEALAPAIGWLDDVGLVLALRLLLAKRLDPYRYPLFEKQRVEALPPGGSSDSYVVSRVVAPR
jgi:uncharacterized membrane protein YkvA (DUF1232 family)